MLAATEPRLIGIAGAMCAGKDTVAQMLEALGCTHVSTSEIVRRELRASGRPETRVAQRAIANLRRAHYGGHYFVAEAVAEARNRGDVCSDVVISGLYTAGEARYFVNQLGGKILYVETASPEVRYERLKARRAGLRDAMSSAGFIEADEAEMSGADDDVPNVSAVAQFAEWRLSNDSDLTYLARLVEDWWEKYEEANPPSGRRRMSEDGRSGLLQSLMGNGAAPAEPLERIDDYESVEALERRARALEFVHKSYFLEGLSAKDRALAPLLTPVHAVQHISNQFGLRLIDAFLQADPQAGLARFRQIEAHTTDEELALLISDGRFCALFDDLHTFLDGQRETIHESVVENLRTIVANDRLQFDGNERRGLARCLRSGVSIRLDPAYVRQLKEGVAESGSGVIPLVEFLKNERMLEVNGFLGSKISLAVHDAIDHVWFFSLAERAGLFQKFGRLFDSIGNPQRTDIFKREGEAVASIAFGVRYWANAEAGFVPRVSILEVGNRYEALFDSGELEDRHIDAYRLVRRLAQNPSAREAQSLAFTFSNYLTELDEQRRKHGRIKQLVDFDHGIKQELDPFSPDYLSFFIEAHHELVASRNKHRDNLLRFHIILEEFLGSEAALASEKLVIHPDRMAEHDFASTLLPPARITWMARNYGFTALRDSVL